MNYTIEKMNQFLCSILIACGFLFIASAYYISQFPQPLLHPTKLTAALLVMFAAYLGMLWSKPKRLSLILILSITVQLVFLQMPAFFNDFFRYLWDGKMSVHGINPFAFFPWAVHDLSATAHLAQVWYWDDMFFKWTHTIYPPMLQILFWASNVIKEDSALVLKSLFFLCNLGSLGIGIKILDTLKKPRTAIALLALNPLFLFETTATAHVEAVLIFFLLLTLYLFITHKRILTGIAFGALMLVKYFPAVLYPLFALKKNGLQKGCFTIGFTALLTIVLLYLPFSFGIEPSLLIESLKVFSSDWVMSPGIFALLQWAMSYETAKFIGTILTLASFLWIYTRYQRHQDVFQATWELFFALILFSSVVFSWYILWLIALLPFIKQKLPTLVLSGTFLLQYLIIEWNEEHSTFVYHQNGEVLWHQLLLWGPGLVLWAVYYVLRERKKSPNT